MDENTRILVKSFNFAAVKHKDQRRKDKDQTPYINHPIGVAHIISEEAQITDTNILISAVLHDTVEDTDTSFEELEFEFGSQIKEIVYQCSDDKTLSKEQRKQKQIEKAGSCCYEAKVVKLADKLYNLRDLERQLPVGWSEERRQVYFEWSWKVVKNIRGTCSPLEESLIEMFKKRNIDMV